MLFVTHRFNQKQIQKPIAHLLRTPMMIYNVIIYLKVREHFIYIYNIIYYHILWHYDMR